MQGFSLKMIRSWSKIVIFGLHIVCAYESFLFPRKYVLHSTKLTWPQGREACRGTGGRLGTIYDVSTIPDLNLTMDYLIKPDELFWIGLFWNDTIQSYSWDNGDNVTWFNWKTRARDNHTGACVAASAVKPFLWQTVACDNRLPYLCQQTGGECRFIKYQNMSIASHNYMYLYGKSEEHCQNVCTNDLGSRCLSFDFNPTDGRCEFNSGNRWTLEQYFSHRQGWVYFHRTCNSGEVLSASVSPSPSFGCFQTTGVIVTSAYIITSTRGVFVSRDVLVRVTSTHLHTVTVTETSTRLLVASPSVIYPSVSIDSVEELKEIGEIAIEKKKTLKKISVEDNRPSAKYVGYVAIVFLSFVFGSIILFDLLTLFRYSKGCCVDKRKENRKQSSHKRLKKTSDQLKLKRRRKTTVGGENLKPNVSQTNVNRFSVNLAADRPGSDEKPSTSRCVELDIHTIQKSKMIWRPFLYNNGKDVSDVKSGQHDSDNSSTDSFDFTCNEMYEERHTNNGVQVHHTYNDAQIHYTHSDAQVHHTYNEIKEITHF